MEELIQLDKDLFVFLNNLGTPFWDGFWLFMTEKLYQIPLYVLLLYFFYKYYGIKGTIITLVIVAALITASDQLSNLFKNVLFMRPRPCRAEGVEEFTRFIAERCGRHGYFSAHAASSMALAFFTGLALQKKLKYIFPFMVVWATVVSYSRIYVGVHYPGDIITGMAIGILLGVGAYKLLMFLVKKYVR
ncbi:phosphatase PAP2 family protein [Aquimarina sp. MMG015]|uniref:phosphatase PAP2 family protein n=1 Tax=unclassified Aquimarina TaxID=2627091 RepID=UPI000E475E72|nr:MULTISPECIES: phosphatase PAP2 family protein [unclassified Aquimarina]AXT56147.1 phosphatase PAP2 family protein [Aquimarina sp. AD1]MBQ4803756.1 phosphatase PAP2 family protein [Aquimarina sp. MMG015]RKN26886.1 phosphatase PAP2 family protein [Aquimarina sp. AD1]